jgi:hypothetical protein
MTPIAIAGITAALTFGSGMLGLWNKSLLSEHHNASETRDLITRITGLVSTMAALILGLLIASGNAYYNTEKANLETLARRAVQLDSTLRNYGPAAQPARDQLKDLLTRGYQRIWQNAGGVREAAATSVSNASVGVLSDNLRALQPETEAQKQLLAKAFDLTASISDLRLQTALELDNSITWPFLGILLAWTVLLFFGYGLLARNNLAAAIALAVGALSVASAIFLILELNAPYGGLMRLAPTPLLFAFDAIGR